MPTVLERFPEISQLSADERRELIDELLTGLTAPDGEKELPADVREELDRRWEVTDVMENQVCLPMMLPRGAASRPPVGRHGKFVLSREALAFSAGG
jgi:hypothetical protein